MKVRILESSVVDQKTDDSESWGGSLIDTLGGISRHVALLAAWIATCGSLFMSEVIGWQPCLLCWYQRILMYPLALILAIGIWRRDRAVHAYVLPFSVLGAGTSMYHYLLIKTTWFSPPPCSASVPCTVDYINWFGFINIPFMALTAFLIITVALVASMLTDSEAVADEPVADDVPAPATGFDESRLAVVMLSVGVALAFMLASTLV